MKKIIAFVLILASLVLSLTACGNKGMTLAELKEKGELVIGSSPDFPPFESLEGEDVVGIEIEIMKKIAEDLGVKLVIEQVNFDSVIPGVKAGKYAVGVSGISVTPKRQKNVLFTDPYCLAAQAIVVTADSAIKTKADLAGKKVSVQTGTTAQTFCQENGYNVLCYTANTDAEQALVTKKVDAWVIDDLTAAAMVAEYNAGKEEKDQLVVLEEAMTTEPYAFALPFGSEEIVAEMNKTIAALLADGTIAELFKQFDAPFTPPVKD